ncbi:MAG: tetratricopeptide repeat protein [Planctomycetota bacterium]|jgi:tetratricopeptide (TPR) repeat protein
MPDRSKGEGPIPQAPGPTRASILLALAVLGCVVCAVFFPVLGYDEFVNLDTSEHIVHNPRVHGLSGENLRHIFSSWSKSSYYPIRALTYAIDCQIWGLDPKGFKLTNGLLHLVNVCLVFWLVLRVFDRESPAYGSPRGWWDVSLATFSAGVFAIHPVVVEPVVWVPGREELLMTLGALGCIHFHLSARRMGDLHGKARETLACHVCATLCCAVACLSNVVGAVIPLLITAWDVLMVSPPKLRKILRGTSALWVIGATAIVLKRVGSIPLADHPEAELFSAERLMVVLNAYWLNLKTLVWPRDLAISYWYVTPKGFADREVILGATALVLTCLALWLLRRRKLALFGLLWFGLALAPVSQILPHHIHRADRFLYLPLVGLTLAAAMGFRPLPYRVKSRAAVGSVAAAGLLALIVLVARSAGQVQTWRNSLAVWKNCVEVAPANAFAHDCLAVCLADEGLFHQAVLQFEWALRIEPDRIDALDNFAFLLAAFPREELREYDRAIALARRGCRLTEWKDFPIRRTLAIAYTNSAAASKRDGRLDRAIESYGSAIEADPEYETPLLELALLLATSSDETFRDYGRAITLATRGCQLTEGKDSSMRRALAIAYMNLATALKRDGQFDRVIENYGNAVNADPEYEAPLLNLALLLATSRDERFRDHDKAAALAERACELAGYAAPVHLSILAHVYAEGGRFEEAIATMETAIRLAARTGDNTEWTQDLQRRLKLYRNGILPEPPLP